MRNRLSAKEHPDRKTLQAFAEGKLTARDVETIGEHLEKCETCVAKVEDFSSQNSLAEKLRIVSKDVTPQNGLDETVAFSKSNSFETTFADQSKFKIIKRIGVGGMGSVYLAEHTIMGRRVAIKIIKPEYLSNPTAISRFQNEVKAAAKLSHRNIVGALDADHFGDSHFLVMEYVDGHSLSEIVSAKGPLAVTTACNFIVQIARGLQHAFEQKMVHRDIKPSNLMRNRDGIVKILDFGIARINSATNASIDLTSSGTMMGTADFVSPEQARDAKSADIRSDLYSLGCTFFFLLTGKAPFDGVSRVDKLIAHCSHDFPDVSNFRQDVPDDVNSILRKLVAKSADDRFQTPKELINALTPFAKLSTTKRVPIQKSSSEKSFPVAVATQASSFDKETSSSNEQVLETLGVAESFSAAPFISNPTKSLSRKRMPSSKKISRSLFIGVGIGLFAFLIFFGVLVWVYFNPPNSKKATMNSAGLGKQKVEKTVVLVISSTDFWYSDYGPMKQALESSGLKVQTVSDRTGLAKFDRKDKIQSARDVQVQKDVVGLIGDHKPNSISAIVFMGNRTENFLNNQQTRMKLSSFLSKLKSEKVWISSIGKGMKIPLELGQYDDGIVCETSWIDNFSNARRRREDICVDSERRYITGESWLVALEFGEQLVKVLNSEN